MDGNGGKGVKNDSVVADWCQPDLGYAVRLRARLKCRIVAASPKLTPKTKIEAGSGAGCPRWVPSIVMMMLLSKVAIDAEYSSEWSGKGL